MSVYFYYILTLNYNGSDRRDMAWDYVQKIPNMVVIDEEKEEDDGDLLD